MKNDMNDINVMNIAEEELTMSYVAKLEAEHILEAMRGLGWELGMKPPSFVDIRLKCLVDYKNGGDGGRVIALRKEAIALAMKENGVQAIEPIETSLSQRLPEELQNVMGGLVKDIAVRLKAFDNVAATHIERYRADADVAAIAKVNAVRRDAAEQSTAFEEEISNALSAIDASNSKIIDLETRLTAALTAEAHAEGRAVALADQVVNQSVRIAELERELKQQKTGSRSHTPKLPVIAAKPAVKKAVNTKTVDPEKSDDPSGNNPADQEDAQVGGNE